MTALARNRNSIPAQDRLIVVQGSPLKSEDVEAAFKASSEGPPEAILVALNSTRTSDNPWAAVTSPPRMMADAHANLLAAMKKHQTKKIVTMSAFGAGDSFHNLNVLMRFVIRQSNMLVTFQDHDLVDKELKDSGADFVLARPAVLTDKEAQAIKTHGPAGAGVGFMPSISRRSVAVFLLDAVEMETWDRITVVISN